MKPTLVWRSRRRDTRVDATTAKLLDRRIARESFPRQADLSELKKRLQPAEAWVWVFPGDIRAELPAANWRARQLRARDRRGSAL